MASISLRPSQPLLVRFLFPSDMLNPRQVDQEYEREADAVISIGSEYGLIDLDALNRENDVEKALKRVAKLDEETMCIYRGWMLTAEKYQVLYSALKKRNLFMVNDPYGYRYAHHLPLWYEDFKEVTPWSTWAETDNLAHFKSGLGTIFGKSPLLVKDFVKSRKHDWDTACYIPCASNEVETNKVIDNFVRLQGQDLAGGVVIREFVELEQFGEHPKSKMPLSVEYRAFIFEGEVLGIYPYWDEGGVYEGTPPMLEEFAEQIHEASRPSVFFSLDLAKKKDGGWIVIELGSGEVAGLPSSVDVTEFYQKLKAAVEHMV